MKYGIITDIHNNVTALRAVLKRLTQINCDGIISVGTSLGSDRIPKKQFRK